MSWLPEGRRGISGETGTDLYTLLCMKQINDKDLLCSTGNSTQYLMIYYRKRIQKTVDLYLNNSVCYTAETNTINQLYSNLKNYLKHQTTKQTVKIQ